MRPYARAYGTGPSTGSESLAFARPEIVDGGFRESGAVERIEGAFTIAVTSPRMSKCKRGLAANVAVALAGMVTNVGSSVCVVDADLESRDIGSRFGVTGPALGDIADDLALRGATTVARTDLAHVDELDLSVVPVRPAYSTLLPLFHRAAADLVGPLRSAFDFVVIDAPAGLAAGREEWERAIMRQVDVLVVAVSADPAALGGLVRYLQPIAADRLRGSLPATFDTHVVLTGTEERGVRAPLTDEELERRLNGIPVSASIPQLWGRRMPNYALGTEVDPVAQREFTALVRKLMGTDPRI